MLPKAGVVSPTQAQPEVVHADWNKLFFLLVETMQPLSWDKASAGKPPVQSRKYYLLVRAPEWKAVNMAPALPLVFDRILGKIDP